MTPAKTKESLEYETPIEPVYHNSDGQGASVLLRDCLSELSTGNSFAEYNEAHFLDFSAYDTEEEEAIVPVNGREVERCCPRECNQILPSDLLYLHRHAFEELTKSDQDLLILSHLQQSRHSAVLEIEYSKQNKVHEPRFAGEEVSRQEIEYYFLALPICRRMYFFLHPMRTKRYRNLIARFDTSLISNHKYSNHKTPGLTGRGRPKKVVPILGVNVGSDLSKHINGKRKRGRPKKSEQLNGSSISSDVQDVKRKRGRPKKSELMIEDVPMIEAHFLSATTKEDSTNGLFIKRKRGRPKKSKLMVDSKPAKAKIVHAATDGFSEDTLVYKRKRGRPRKSKEVTESVEAHLIPFVDTAVDANLYSEYIIAEQISDIVATDSSLTDFPAVKRKRGRPKKSKIMMEKTPELEFSDLTAYRNPNPNFVSEHMQSVSGNSDFVSENTNADDTQTSSNVQGGNSIDGHSIKRKRGRPRKSESHKTGDTSTTYSSTTEAKLTDASKTEPVQVQARKIHEKVVENAELQDMNKNKPTTDNSDVSEDTDDSEDTEDSTEDSDDSDDSEDSEDTDSSESSSSSSIVEIKRKTKVSKNTEDSEKSGTSMSSNSSVEVKRKAGMSKNTQNSEDSENSVNSDSPSSVEIKRKAEIGKNTQNSEDSESSVSSYSLLSVEIKRKEDVSEDSKSSENTEVIKEAELVDAQPASMNTDENSEDKEDKSERRELP